MLQSAVPWDPVLLELPIEKELPAILAMSEVSLSLCMHVVIERLALMYLAGSLLQIMFEIRRMEAAAGGRRLCPVDVFRKGI